MDGSIVLKNCLVRFMKILECSEPKLPVLMRITFAGRHGIILCYYINPREGNVERRVTCDEMCVSIIPVLDLTLMGEQGVNIPSGC